MKRNVHYLRALLIIVLTLMMSFTSLGINVNAIKAEDEYRIEIFRGFNRGLSSNGMLATEFIKNPVDTGYSYYGYTEEHTRSTTASGNKLTSYQQKQEASSKVSKVTVYNGIGDPVSFDLSNTTSGKTLYIDSNKHLTTVSSGNSAVLVVASNSTAFTCRFVYVNCNLDIVLEYANSKTATFKNVKNIKVDEDTLENNYIYNLEDNKATIKLPGKAVTSAYGSHPYFDVEKLDGSLQSIDIVYAGKYYGSIDKEMLDGNYYFTKNTSVTPNTINPVEGSPGTLSANIPLSYNNGRITLYEVSGNYEFTYNYEFDITFNPNGGKFSDLTSTPKVITTEENAIESLPSGISRDQENGKTFVFKGWYTSSTDFTDANKVVDGATFEENTTLYAGYDQTYKITFDPGIGTIAENEDYSFTDIDSQILHVDDMKTLVSNTIVDANDENIKYHFKGWYDNNVGNYDEAHHITVLYKFDSDKTVYAIWERNYKITLDINGGEFSDYTTANKTLYTDSVGYYGTLDSLYAVRQGIDTNNDNEDDLFALNAWYTSPTDFTDENKVIVGETVFNEDTTIYAGWTNERETVNFYSDGVLYATKVVGKGLTTSAPSNPTKDGYTFVAWYTDDQTFLNEFDFSQAINADIDLYARFEQTVSITVNGAMNDDGDEVEANNAISFSNITDRATVIKNQNVGTTLKVYAVHGTLDKISINGNEFDASELIGNVNKTVYIDANGQKQDTSSTSDMLSIDYVAGNKYITINVLTLNSDTTVDLIYKDVEIKFMKDGSLYATRYIPFNTASTIEKPNDPSKTGYSFIGWYKEDTFENEFEFENVTLVDDTKVYALLSKDYYLNVYYGYGREHGSTNTLLDVFTGAGAMLNNDTGYSLKGSRSTAYVNGPSSGTGNRYDKPWQVEVDYVDVYLNGSKETVNHQISPKGFSIISKDLYYTSEGTLTTSASGNTHLVKFANSADAENGSIASRWYAIPGAIDVVMHYYDEHKITINDITTSTVSEDYDKYFVNKETAKKTITTISGDYSDSNGIELSVTPEDRDVDHIVISNGNKNVTIELSQLNETLYLSSSYTLSTSHTDNDILKYENNKFTFYNVNEDINIDYEYRYTVSLVPGIGALVNGETSVKTTNYKIERPALVSETVNVSGTDWYFVGWYNSNNELVDFDDKILADDTFTARWTDIPSNNIVVKNAYAESGNNPIQTNNASAYTAFNGSQSTAMIQADVVGAEMDIYAVHGTLKDITVKLNDSTSVSINDFASTRYIDENGIVTTIAPIEYKVVISKVDDNKYHVVFNSIENDLTITLNYEQVNVEFVYDDNSEASTAQTIDFATKASKPEDPVKEGYWFDGWYSDDTFSEEFDFNKAILDDTVIYAKTSVKHTIKYINTVPSSTSGKISSSEWESRVGAGLFDAANATSYTRGDFVNTSGVASIFNAAGGLPTSITFTYNNKEVVLTGDEIALKNNTTPNDGLFLLEDGTYEVALKGGTVPTNAVVKFVHDKDYDNGGYYYNLRYYRITSDITITIEYPEVNVKYIDNDDATLVFNIDAKTPGTVIGDDLRSFTVASSELKGDNANSIRFAIDPNLTKVRGLRFTNADDANDYEDFTFTAEGNYDATLTKFGNIKVAYSIASGATDGILYVRFLNLYSDLIISPIITESKVSHKATLLTAENLTVSHDALPDGVSISSDNKTLTAEYGALYKVTTNAQVGASSFRWNLAPIAGYDLEYSKIEILDASNDAVLATIGESLVSYKTAVSDQTVTLMNFANGIFVKYNKALDSSAQLRIWALNKDVKLKVYYKDFTNGGSDIAYENADFAPYNVKVTLKQTIDDAKKSDVKYSFITPNSTITNKTINENGVDYQINSITLPSNDLTGNNEQISTIDDLIVSGIVRLSLVDHGKYAVKKVTVSVGGDNPVIYELTSNQTIKDNNLGQFQYVRNTTDTHIRFNRIFTKEEIIITVEYESIGDGPYTGELVIDDALSLNVDNSSPASVTVQSGSKKIVVPEDALPAATAGKSLLWNLSSTAGMGYEYSKVEVYLQNPENGLYELATTLGENFESYKTYKDGEKDQTQGKQLVGLSVRYNKSHYGEAQIRIWNVYKNFKIVTYYKDYATGKEYKANDSALKLVYDGVITIKLNGAVINSESMVRENKGKKPVELLNGYTKIRFNKYAKEADGYKYMFETKNLGDNIDYATITIDGKSYDIGQDTAIGKVTGKVFPGARIRFYRSTDGYAQIRAWAVSNDVDIELHVSHGHSNLIRFDVGDHGSAKVTDIPSGAKVLTKDWSLIRVKRGETPNSKAGNKTSIRYDVTPDIGYDIDYIIVNVSGESHRLDAKTLPNGTTLLTKILNGVSIRYNLDSNGIAQIRAVHVDRDCSIKVYYRKATHKVIMNTQKLAVIRAEGYTNAVNTKFSKNYAVAYVEGGTTTARQSGIKYWFEPLDGHEITSIMIENSRGDYVTAGGTFAPTEWEDVKVKGVVVRYYQGYDGKIELRVWGVLDDIKITLFYDGETPRRGVKVPEDIETYDIGNYIETFDNKVIDEYGYDVEPETNPTNSANYLPYVIAGGGAVVVGGVIYFIAKRKNKKAQ